MSFTLDETTGNKKIVMDMEAPLSGEILAANEFLKDESDRINDEPYEAWLIEVKVASLADELIDEEAYLSRIDKPWMQNH